jgi:hypothetical protein
LSTVGPEELVGRAVGLVAEGDLDADADGMLGKA